MRIGDKGVQFLTAQKSEWERNKKGQEKIQYRSVRKFRHCAKSALISILYHQTETKAHKRNRERKTYLHSEKRAPDFNPSGNKTRTTGNRQRVEAAEMVEETDLKTNCPRVKGKQNYSPKANGTVRSHKMEQQFSATLEQSEFSL